MRVLVVGSGGREHALCWAIAASPLCDELLCAAGNAGIAGDAECVAVAADDFDSLIGLCRERSIDFVVVGPEAPLVAGLVDRLQAAGIKSFGPAAAAAAIEGSKGFTKDLCHKYRIPSGAYVRFTDSNAAKAYIREQGAPIVIKADGLAAGKGVVVAETLEEALAAIDTLGAELGDAAAAWVIEEKLIGQEASFHALVDGIHAVPLAAAQDHKAVGDGDTGPNTGGMGAYSPTPAVDDAMANHIMARIIEPTVAAMAAEGRPFKGVLYCGLMLTADGPKVIEYNARFGDPEAQVMLPRLMSDLLPALVATADGVLDKIHLRWYDEAALCVIMATNGYPGAYGKGSVIGGLDAAGDNEGVTIFHAGTKQDGDNVTAAGGRVLGVTATAPSIAEAQTRAYGAIDTIDWPEGFCRRDIGWRAVGMA
ncbi:MAG: phosphoribosylamine--glycine ligase [Pseudomonadota bacterium]|nr:phosphoribosylamine--glycine ligase [Pseudomonadota bacterium]